MPQFVYERGVSDARVSHSRETPIWRYQDLPKLMWTLSSECLWFARADTPDALHQIHVDRAAIEAKVQRAVGGWRELLSGSVADGRQMLREVLEAPLRLTPRERPTGCSWLEMCRRRAAADGSA
jgi:hypothetical protein